MPAQDDLSKLEMEFRDPPLIFKAKKLRETAAFFAILAFFNIGHEFDHHDESLMDQNHDTAAAEWTQDFTEVDRFKNRVILARDMVKNDVTNSLSDLRQTKVFLQFLANFWRLETCPTSLFLSQK